MLTTTDFLTNFYNDVIARGEGCFYAIFDKTKPVSNSEYNYAGIAALAATNPVNQVTELGCILFPTYQRTHVGSNAIGLLLLWILDPPSLGGLGLRRVSWQTNTENFASRRVAERMGFELEGIARWQRISPGTKFFLPVVELEKRNGKREEPGRHTAVYSLVWDEWEAKRPIVVEQMRLRIKSEEVK
jgi:RimJ/RimL family protein N-acetyltransferase